MQDHGPNPYVIDAVAAANQNIYFCSTLWTGSHLQVTVMAVPPEGDTGLTIQKEHDQYIRVESGSARLVMGKDADNLQEWLVADGYAFVIPAGTCHNIINNGLDDLKMISLHGPVKYLRDTIHASKEEALSEQAEQASSGSPNNQ
ncbi:MAG: cupin domain-containing protein [Candidatus Saccharimonadales bacterium]